jgi:hypothetical protein
MLELLNVATAEKQHAMRFDTASLPSIIVENDRSTLRLSIPVYHYTYHYTLSYQAHSSTSKATVLVRLPRLFDDCFATSAFPIGQTNSVSLPHYQTPVHCPRSGMFSTGVSTGNILSPAYKFRHVFQTKRPDKPRSLQIPFAISGQDDLQNSLL